MMISGQDAGAAGFATRDQHWYRQSSGSCLVGFYGEWW
jgi:hypothetical protein